MSTQDENDPQDPGQRPDDYLHTNPDGSQTPQYPGQAPEPPANPYGSAETSSYGTPPTHSPYGGPPAPPTQPYAAQPPAHGQDPYAQQSGPYGSRARTAATCSRATPRRRRTRRRPPRWCSAWSR